MPVVIPYVPEQITVHLGPPDSNAANVTLPFTDYVKNVASSEIYPTWDESALRANILAIISFALNRVYTEFYRSRGYNFEITNSTAYDQAFVNGRNTFENIDAIVDDIFNNYLRRPGFVEPLAAKFCNGTTVTCEGLSQWGSQNLAEQGYNSVDSLRTYYGDNIEIVTNAPVQGLVQSYPGTALRRGSTGPNVVVVQTSLNRVGQNYPAIPKISPVDGIFGSQTENAVRRFQEIFGLTPDGVVGRATWYALVRLYVGVTSLAELRSQGQQFYNISWNYGGALQQGSQGQEVRQLQYMLQVLSSVIPAIPPVEVDGIFGPATRASVLAAQRYFGLPQSGAVDEQTWLRLESQFRSIDNNLFRNQELFPFAPEGGAAAQTAFAPATPRGQSRGPRTGTSRNEPPARAGDRYSQTTRMTQFPGAELSMGQQDGVPGEVTGR